MFDFDTHGFTVGYYLSRLRRWLIILRPLRSIAARLDFVPMLDAQTNSKLQKLVPFLLRWFSKNARDLPWRRTRDPTAIWVSEIMLQQTQVKTVMPYWERWMRELPTIESIANASADKIHKLWEGLGYYTRVRNLQKAAQVIVEKHGGKFPENFDDVLALPGIGRYTAGAICSIAFNQPTPLLDGNVIRVLTRIFGIAENPKEKQTNARLWTLAENLVTHAKAAKSAQKFSALRPSRPLREENSCSHLNQSLMELGALICTPRSPKCLVCPARKLCVAFKENRIDELPNLGKREKATVRKFVAFVIECDGKFLVQQRPAGIVNAHLWEFPNFETNGDKLAPTELFREKFSVTPEIFQPLCTIKHSITRYRITLEVWRVEALFSVLVTNGSKVANAPGRSLVFQGQWLTLARLHTLAFTSAHKKILNQL